MSYLRICKELKLSVAQLKIVTFANIKIQLQLNQVHVYTSLYGQTLISLIRSTHVHVQLAHFPVVLTLIFLIRMITF